MRKLILLLIAIVFAVTGIMAQTPNEFKYQAILRNASGSIIESEVVTVDQLRARTPLCTSKMDSGRDIGSATARKLDGPSYLGDRRWSRKPSYRSASARCRRPSGLAGCWFRSLVLDHREKPTPGDSTGCRRSNRRRNELPSRRRNTGQTRLPRP